MSEITFRVVENGNGSGSGIQEAGSMVVRDPLEWISVLNQVNRSYGFGEDKKTMVQIFSNPPLVDFSTETVIAVFRGFCSTGGYGIQVVRVIEKGDKVRVVVQTKGHGGMAAMVVTYPYQIIAIPRTEKPIIVGLLR